MFWRILKKDLKRKKTMNIILLLFVILSAAFAAAAVNNINAVTNGIDYFFDVADVPDALVQTPAGSGLEEKIAELPSVKDMKIERWLFIFSSKNFRLNGKKLDNFINMPSLISDKEMAINYFDENDNIIKSVDKGCFYATSSFSKGIDIREGDEVELEVGESKLTLKYMGRFKNAIYGTESSGSVILLINSEDHAYLDKDEAVHQLDLNEIYVNTTDIDELKQLTDSYGGAFTIRREDLKGIYFYDMLAAYILMAISIILMFTAFVVLRFTIGFTISEEFHEIGVMKAVGIDNGSIRRLYIIKYLALSVVGAVIGFFVSIPLCNTMMKTVTANMVLNGESVDLMGLISSGAVVVIIMLFCYGCTRSVNKLSPIDAVRNGQTGERFRKRSFMHLGRSKLPSTAFLAVNDVISSPKQFGIITVIFALCMLMMSTMSNFAVTLKSEKILWLFDVPESEVHILDTEFIGRVLTDRNEYKNLFADTEKLLAEKGMPGKCTMLLSSSHEVTHRDKKAEINFNVTKGSNDHVLRMDEGSAPQRNDEIAMTISALRSLNAEIGDRVTAVIGDKEYEFIITGRYSSFTSVSAFVYKDFDFGDVPVMSCMGLQIHFDGSPDKETIDSNVALLKNILDSDKVYNSSEMIKTMTGMSDTLNSIKRMMMMITVIVTAMIVILMERSFISKEKSEIALMKAMGISGGSIVAQHTLRFVIVSILACILSGAALMPVSNGLMSYICLMIGDVSHINCDLDPAEVFVICPGILLTVTVIGAFLTALYTKRIKASDTASIE